LNDAQGLGYNDFCDGINDAPVIFRDTPELVRAWNAGRDMAEDGAAMAECPGCNDGTGNPCYLHG